MQVLLYNELNPQTIQGFAKWQTFMEADDLKSADVKKIGDNLYRAKLNRTDRLLLSFYHYQGQRYALVLEYLKNHDYANSRFLRGVARINEEAIPLVTQLPDDLPELVYVNPQSPRFNLLDKIIAFDDVQQAIYPLPPPLVIIGSAGSGKTALILEKMKTLTGDILYVTLSAYLARHARDLYYAHAYDNPQQQVDFLSFQEFLESIQIPVGKPLDFQTFTTWFSRQPRSPIKDAYQLFEEFRGVITGGVINAAYLSREQYLNLGVKQSIFLKEERDAVYTMFTSYLRFLQENGYYDSNIISHHYLTYNSPRYDFVVVDEVQDLTNSQLYLILNALRKPHRFLLCGDANQIVHPNFFSWSKIKSLFYQANTAQDTAEAIRLLQTNYRNSSPVIALANRLLLLKQARFGSIDRESHYRVQSNGQVQGNVIFLQDRDAIRRELNAKTCNSTSFAVVVMHEAQKREAQQYFNTPLVFSIQEVKGLEYENIILYNVISAEAKRFQEVCAGVNPADLQGDLPYARRKNKTDKSLEIYKFYVNALYVALTRAVRNVYWIEADSQHRLLYLLELEQARDNLTIANQGSSWEDWQREAQRLSLQGKQEQAERIRREILQQQTPTWTVYRGDTLQQLYRQAIHGGDKQARLMAFEIALIHEDTQWLRDLLFVDFKPARYPENGMKGLQQKYYLAYQAKNPQVLRQQLQQFGIDFRNTFNQTPLMAATWLGNAALVEALVADGADIELVNNQGFTAFQIALQQATKDEKYAKKTLERVYAALAPDSISIQVDAHLIKLDKHSMEFFLLNLLIALFYRVLPAKVVQSGGFGTQEILDAIAHFPDTVLPKHRKQRAYLSAVLAKNEMYRESAHNYKLFYRVRQGNYLFNPSLMLRVAGEWVNIYQLLPLDKLTYRAQTTANGWNKDAQRYCDQEMEWGRSNINQALQKARIDVLNHTLSMLKVLCEQELHRIASQPVSASR